MGANQVTVASQESTMIEDFAASEPRTVAVQVRRPDGTPFTEGTIQHVDPMHDAWDQFTQLPTTGSFASGHIPSPSRFPLDANGVATLTGVRHQNLVLDLRAYAGWNLRTTFDAVPKHTEPGFKLDWTVEIRAKD